MHGVSPAQDALVAKRIVLGTHRVDYTQDLGSFTKDSLRVTLERNPHVFEDLGEHLVARLRGYVLEQHLATNDIPVEIREEFGYETWDTWWDHLKAEAIAPLRLYGWIARRWPPKTRKVVTDLRFTRTIHLERKAMFPGADVAFHDTLLGTPVLFEAWRVDY